MTVDKDNRACAGWGIWLAAVWMCFGAPVFAIQTPPSWQSGLRKIDLPALAVVDRHDDSGDTWQQTGRVPLVFRAAVRHFQTTLVRQKWKLDKSMPIGNHRNPLEVLLFRQGKRQLLVMLWEIQIGETGFALGEDLQTGLRR